MSTHNYYGHWAEFIGHGDLDPGICAPHRWCCAWSLFIRSFKRVRFTAQRAMSCVWRHCENKIDNRLKTHKYGTKSFEEKLPFILAVNWTLDNVMRICALDKYAVGCSWCCSELTWRWGLWFCDSAGILTGSAHCPEPFWCRFLSPCPSVKHRVAIRRWCLPWRSEPG